MRELERTAAGLTSLERLRSVVAELDVARAGAGGSLPDAVRGALAAGDVAALLEEWDRSGTRWRARPPGVCCGRWCHAWW